MDRCWFTAPWKVFWQGCPRVCGRFDLGWNDLFKSCQHLVETHPKPRTCMERRHKRGKASRKQDVENSKLWFRDSIWSHYLRYKQKQLSNAVGALRVDGEVSKEEILSQCLPYCTKMVSARVQVVLRSRKEAASANSTNGANGRKICDRENGRSAPQKRPQEDNYESRGCSRRYR